MNRIQNEVMLAEIREQPTALGLSLKTMQQTVSAMKLAPLDTAATVYLTGCGDGSWLPQVARFAFERHLGIVCQALPAMEVSQYAPLKAHDLVVFMSMSGEVPRTLEAMESAIFFGAKSLAITANANSSLGKGCRYVLELPRQASSLKTPHSLNFSMTLLALFVILEGLCKRDLALDHLLESMTPTIDVAVKNCQAFVELTKSSGVFWFLGAGPHWGMAMYAASLWRTASGMSSVALELEDIVHGSHLALQPKDAVGLIATPGRSLDRALELLPGLQELGMRPILIGADAQNESHLSLPLASPTLFDEEWSPLLTAPLVQVLCWACASVRGFDVVAKKGRVPNPTLYDTIHRRWRNDSIRRPRH